MAMSISTMVDLSKPSIPIRKQSKPVQVIGNAMEIDHLLSSIATCLKKPFKVCFFNFFFIIFLPILRLDAEQAIELNRDYVKGYVWKFTSLYKLGRFQQGDQTFADACTRFPDYQVCCCRFFTFFLHFIFYLFKGRHVFGKKPGFNWRN